LRKSPDAAREALLNALKSPDDSPAKNEARCIMKHIYKLDPGIFEPVVIKTMIHGTENIDIQEPEQNKAYKTAEKALKKKMPLFA
jgi:hypothetical protein